MNSYLLFSQFQRQMGILYAQRDLFWKHLFSSCKIFDITCQCVSQSDKKLRLNMYRPNKGIPAQCRTPRHHITFIDINTNTMDLHSGSYSANNVCSFLDACHMTFTVIVMQITFIVFPALQILLDLVLVIVILILGVL